jgi:hypothetical protein
MFEHSTLQTLSIDLDSIGLKVVIFIPASDIFLCPIRIHVCIFYFIYSCICLEPFLSGAMNESA